MLLISYGAFAKGGSSSRTGFDWVDERSGNEHILYLIIGPNNDEESHFLCTTLAYNIYNKKEKILI